MTSNCSIAVSAAALTLTVVLAPVRSKATDDDINQRVEKIYDDCGERWGFPGAIATCVLDEEKKYGLELERLYKRLLKDATINVAVLRESQRNWLKYQKQTCKLYELEAAKEGPGIARVSSARCLLRTTLQRIEELRELLP